MDIFLAQELISSHCYVQATRARSFDEDGAFTKLPKKEAHALVEMARKSVREMREIDRSDHAELDAYHTAKRKSNSQLELDALVHTYALALSFFDRCISMVSCVSESLIVNLILRVRVGLSVRCVHVSVSFLGTGGSSVVSGAFGRQMKSYLK